MKVRDLFIVAAFVLGATMVAYRDDGIRALRDWQYTSPLCIWVEEAWADATGATRVRLAAELARQKALFAGAERSLVRVDEAHKVVQAKLRESLALQIEELGRADLQIAKLSSDLEHSERVRDIQNGELAHCRQLLEAQESVVRETNWRYQMLCNRLRELGQEGAVSVLVKE